MLIKRNNQLLFINGINPIAVSAANMDAVYNAFINGLNPANNILPLRPPVERHPYSLAFPIVAEFDRYIIGTFPPISYLTDVVAFGLVLPNNANVGMPNVPFYHGNMEGLWQPLFDAGGVWAAYQAITCPMCGNNTPCPLCRNNKKGFIINWLFQNNINVCDIVSYTTRFAYNANDNNLYNIYPNWELMNTIYTSPKKVSILFNTSSMFGMRGLNLRIDGQIREKAQSFNIFLRAFQKAGARIYIDLLTPLPCPQGWVQVTPANVNLINVNSPYKCVIKIKIVFEKSVEIDDTTFEKGTKEIYCVFGPSPANQAAIQLGGNLIYQNVNAGLALPMNHANFCAHMYGHFLNFWGGGLAALQGLNQ